MRPAAARKLSVATLRGLVDALDAASGMEAVRARRGPPVRKAAWRGSP